MYRLKTFNAVWISCNIMTSEAEDNKRHQRIMKQMGLRDLKSVPIDPVKGTLKSPRIDCMNLLYGGTSYFDRSPLCCRRLEFSFVWWNVESTYEKNFKSVFYTLLTIIFFFVESNFHFLTNSDKSLAFCLLLVSKSKSLADVFIISSSKLDW